MLSLPATPTTHEDAVAARDDDALVDGPVIRRLVVALVVSGVLSTLALVLLLGTLLDLPR